MSMKQLKSLLNLLSLTGVVIVLNACSSEPSPWTKSESPWDQRSKTEAEAPAADVYKADLEMSSEPVNDVELDYQAESVEAYAPGLEPAEEVVVEEPVIDVSGVTGSIMDHPATYYTIQLMASIDIDRVHNFAEQNQLSTQYIVPTVRDGVTWHVLLLDVYADYSSAVAGRDEIADTLKTQPWIRRVGSVQKLMQ